MVRTEFKCNSRHSKSRHFQSNNYWAGASIVDGIAADHVAWQVLVTSDLTFAAWGLFVTINNFYIHLDRINLNLTLLLKGQESITSLPLPYILLISV